MKRAIGWPSSRRIRIAAVGLTVTIETIDELYLGPLRNDDEFLAGVARCVG